MAGEAQHGALQAVPEILGAAKNGGF